MGRGSEAQAPPPPPPAPPGPPAQVPRSANDPPASTALHTGLPYLTAALAHELRNPLNSMNIHLKLLEDRLPRGLEEQAVRSLIAVREGIARIDGSLDRFLAALGAPESERAPAPIRELLNEAAERAAQAASAAGVHLSVLVEGDAGRWPIDAPAVAAALDALIDNAMAASRPGGSVRLVARLSDADGERGEIRVEDDGEGMTREALAQATRIGVSSRGHAGLGLAVARQAIRGQGGRLTLSSEGLGRGTTARIELPLFG